VEVEKMSKYKKLFVVVVKLDKPLPNYMPVLAQ